MNAIFSIHKQFSDRIFEGTKPIEFRNILPKKLNIGDKVYIYETKKYGCGKVVGYFIVDKIDECPHTKLGAYNYINLYAKMFGSDEQQRLIEKAMKIDLNNCYNDLVLSFLFMEECLDEMLETKRPPEKSLNDFYNYKFRIYQKIKQEQNTFLNNCDKWLNDMGFYDVYGEAHWKHRIWIRNPYCFNKPLDINAFQNQSSMEIQKAPQSYCYTITNEY